MPSAAIKDSRDSTCHSGHWFIRSHASHTLHTQHKDILILDGRPAHLERWSSMTALNASLLFLICCLPLAAGGCMLARHLFRPHGWMRCYGLTDLGDAFALHSEAANGPVAAADGALHALTDHLHVQVLSRIKLARPVRLRQRVVRLQPAITAIMSRGIPTRISSTNIPNCSRESLEVVKIWALMYCAMISI